MGEIFHAKRILKDAISVQGHHALMDGIHMGRFYAIVQDYLSNPGLIFSARYKRVARPIYRYKNPRWSRWHLDQQDLKSEFFSLILLCQIPLPDIEERRGAGEAHVFCNWAPRTPQIGVLPNAEHVNLVVDDAADLVKGGLSLGQVDLGDLFAKQAVQFRVANACPVLAIGVAKGRDLIAEPLRGVGVRKEVTEAYCQISIWPPATGPPWL